MKIRFTDLKWNFPALKRKSAEEIALKYKTIVERDIQNVLNRVEKKIISDIKKHPVTKEILGRNAASNISGTLGGYGNIWSFIGFEQGDDPVQALISSIEGKMEVTNYKRVGDYVSVTISTPTLSEIYQNTPIPWAAGRSWVEGISSGISGFGKYFSADIPYSRSGGGVQFDKNIRGGSFRPTDYVNKIVSSANQNLINQIKQNFSLK